MGAFDGWLDAVLNSQFVRNIKAAQLRDRVQRIVTEIKYKPKLPQVIRYYEGLPPEMKANPDVLAAYNERVFSLGELQPVNNTEIERIINSAHKPFEEMGMKIAKIYMDIPAATPETALNRAIAIVGLDFAKDIGIGVTGLAAEALSLGQIDATTDFFKFFKSKTSYGGVMTMLMKAPLELGVYAPLSYGLHAQFRDLYLRGQTALTLATKGHISEERMRKAYAYEGYQEWMIDAVVKDRWRELRLGEIAWAFNDALIDSEWLNEKLRLALYAPEDRPVIVAMIQAKYLRTYRDRVATQLRNQYKEGYISAQDFRIKLAAAGIPLKVRDMLIKEADLLFSFDMNADQIAAWEAQYLKTPSMTDAELRALYSTIIVDPARIEPRIAKVRAQRSKTPALPKPVTQGAKVSSKPSWAQISLDFLDTGKLTPETVETSIGEHKLTISADGYEPYREDFRVKEGEFVEIYAMLSPLPELPE